MDYEVLLVESDPDAYDALLQRDREPDPVVHPALPVGPLERPGHPPGGGGRVGRGLRGREPGPRRGGHPHDRGRGGPARDAPRLPPLHGAGAHPRGAARRLPPALRPHPVDPGRLLAGPASAHPRGDLPGHARQRHHRLSHQRLLPELPPLLPPSDGARGRLRPDGGHPRGRRDLGAGLPARDRRRAPRSRSRVRRGRRSTRRSCCAAAATT